MLLLQISQSNSQPIKPSILKMPNQLIRHFLRFVVFTHNLLRNNKNIHDKNLIFRITTILNPSDIKNTIHMIVK